MRLLTMVGIALEGFNVIDFAASACFFFINTLVTNVDGTLLNVLTECHISMFLGWLWIFQLLILRCFLGFLLTEIYFLLSLLICFQVIFSVLPV